MRKRCIRHYFSLTEIMFDSIFPLKLNVPKVDFWWASMRFVIICQLIAISNELIINKQCDMSRNKACGANRFSLSHLFFCSHRTGSLNFHLPQVANFFCPNVCHFEFELFAISKSTNINVLQKYLSSTAASGAFTQHKTMCFKCIQVSCTWTCTCYNNQSSRFT